MDSISSKLGRRRSAEAYAASTLPADSAIIPAKAVAGEEPAVIGKAEAIKVQGALIAAGLLSGKADGSLGERSKGAIRKWQATKGHAATGQLTASQLRALIEQ